MSSAELLDLFGVYVIDDTKAKVRTIRVEFVDEDGAIARAMRDGERSEWKEMLRQVANSTAVLRAAHAPGADTDEYGERLFLAVWREHELFDEHEARAREIEQVRSEIPEVGGMSAMWTQQPVQPEQPEQEVS